MQKPPGILVLLLLGCASVAPAQSLYGSLVGNVADESGAALTRAAVTATQTETNFSRSVLTNETGGYNLPNLLPGTYQLTVTLPGFQTFTAREVNVEANAAIRLDARLKIGEVKDSVSVEATAVALADRDCRRPVEHHQRPIDRRADQRTLLANHYCDDARGFGARLRPVRRYQ